MSKLSLVLIIEFLISCSTAFKPNFGDDSTHQSITECAVYRIVNDFLRNEFGADTYLPRFVNGKCGNAKEQIRSLFKRLDLPYLPFYLANTAFVVNNAAVDGYLMFETEPHCDSETLSGCASRILNFKTSAIKLINSDKSYDMARILIGSLFHTLQDFYSHSNWVEFSSDINKNLGVVANAGPTVSDNIDACFECRTPAECQNNINSGLLTRRLLTSGYFSLNPKARKPYGKCSHGGSVDGTAVNKFDGINKDTLNSPHGHLHYKAAELAERATYSLLNNIWTNVGNSKFGRLLGLSMSSIGFSIDTTYSMQPTIEGVKRLAIKIVNEIKSSSRKPFNYILSPFNDPGYGPLTITKDPEYLIQKISELHAVDGGDIPEMFYSGLLAALKVCEPNSIIWTFTDAPAKDTYLINSVKSLIVNKKVTVNNVYLSTGYTNYLTNDSNTAYNINQYNEISGISGGITLRLPVVRIPELSAIYMDEIKNENEMQTLVYANLEKPTDIKFNVDETIKELKFYILSSSIYAIQYTIKDPLEKVYLEYEKTLQSNLADYFTIKAPVTGIWTIKIASSTTNVKVIGLSSLSVQSQVQVYNNNAVHAGYDKIENSLIQGSKCSIMSVFADFNKEQDFEDVSIELLATDYTVIQQLPFAQKINSKEFVSQFTVPNVSFKIKTIAKFTGYGKTVERIEPELFLPSPYNIEFKFENGNKLTANAKPGSEFNLLFSIQNTRNRDADIIINIFDTLEVLAGNKFASIRANSTLDGSVKMIIPKTFDADYVVDKITLSVRENREFNSNDNFATLYVFINSGTFLSFNLNFIMLCFFFPIYQNV